MTGRRGFTLMSLALALALASLSSVVVLAYIHGQMDTARAKRTATEIKSLLRATLDYRWRSGTWPPSVASLGLPSGTISNPWGVPYTLSFSGKTVTVSTIIPAGVKPLTGDPLLSIVLSTGALSASATLDGGPAQAAAYEKNHLYLESTP
jgi:type II secretory pathway pseudopilin PulG